jgi:hypothetical protein
MDFEQR